MLSALQLCGASLDDYLHLLVPPIVKVFHTTSNPIEVRRYSSINDMTYDFVSLPVELLLRPLRS